MELDDTTLWSRLRAGDRNAFEALFERHARAIYNYGFHRLGDWSAAEDFVSLVFLEAWRRREKELEPGKVLPWLFGIATNVLRNQRRSERRFAAALARVPGADENSGFADDVNERLDDERKMKRALQLLSRLPKREQDVFVLCSWSGLSYEEASFALDVPVGTVRSRLSRARARLRELNLVCGHEPDETTNSQEAFEL
jgi:RNA polymerase sigma-70 factor (ECF subfamily)